MPIPDKLLNLYNGLSGRELFYIKARWGVSPIGAIEKAIPECGDIYDIGCGVGLLSNMAALNSGRRNIVGIDVSGEKIGIANRSIGGRKNIRFEKGDVLNFDFDKADAVVACDLFHHIPFREQGLLLDRILRSLKPGGLLIVQEIDKTPILKYLFALGVDKILNRMARVYYRDCYNMEGFFAERGLKVEVKKIDNGYPIAAMLFKCEKI